jgi:hypothetical protein
LGDYTFMTRFVVALLFLGAVLLSGGDVTKPGSITFNKDVLPVLQQHCQSCHRPGQVAPMSFLTYESTRPWAKAMKVEVVSRKMPPWFADPHYGHFANDRTLSQADIDTLTKWADTGAREGDPKDAPKPIQWPEAGWDIKPDVVVDGPEFNVPAKGLVEWMWVTIPSGFTKDTWVTSIEIRPNNLAVTHHICLFFKPHSAGVEYNAPVWDDKPRDSSGHEIPTKGIPQRNKVLRTLAGASIEACYVPGMASMDFRPYNAAKLIPAGSDFVFVLHYTPIGKEVTARPQIGFTVAKEAPQRQFITLTEEPAGVTDPDVFAIPPNNPNWESPPMEGTFLEDVEMVWMMPHMHLRGKDMQYKVVYPNGESETLLNVPRYDFNWQLGYDVAKPIKLPKGTKLIVTAHYDNSPNNKFNPDPNRTVYHGDMTWEEMMSPFYGVVVDHAVAPNKVFKKKCLPSQVNCATAAGGA